MSFNVEMRPINGITRKKLRVYHVHHNSYKSVTKISDNCSDKSEEIT